MKSTLLAVLAVFALLGTGIARADVLSLWDGTGANDSTSWSGLGSDGTTIPQSFTATSTDGVAISGSFAGSSGLVAVQCPASSCSWTGGFTGGDTLVWALDNTTNSGTGPLTLGFGKAVLAGGVEIQSDVPGQFTAQVEAFDGSSLLGTENVTSDANGDPVFIGAQDTAADITRLVFACTGTCANNDFAVDTLISKNPAAVVVPEPATLPLFATGLGLLGLLGWCRKRKAQAAA